MGLIDKLQASMFRDPREKHPAKCRFTAELKCDLEILGKITNIEVELELYRLEQRYARRKHRSTFSTGAQYVDGEYVYSGARSPTSTVSKHSTGSWRPSGWGSQTSR
ncbi:hypothetical protein NUH16_000163 [Penicillium rubens]|jgi:hypothetical protein|nr:hypothetical protein NUH16_000163 [Penicillium rubens]